MESNFYILNLQTNWKSFIHYQQILKCSGMKLESISNSGMEFGMCRMPRKWPTSLTMMKLQSSCYQSDVYFAVFCLKVSYSLQVLIF